MLGLKCSLDRACCTARETGTENLYGGAVGAVDDDAIVKKAHCIYLDRFWEVETNLMVSKSTVPRINEGAKNQRL